MLHLLQSGQMAQVCSCWNLAISAQGLQTKASGVQSPCPLGEVVSGKSALGVLIIVSKSEAVFVRPSVHPLAACTQLTRLRVKGVPHIDETRVVTSSLVFCPAVCLSPALLCKRGYYWWGPQ